jgi:cyclase
MSTIHHDVTTPAPPQLHEVDDGVFAYIQPDGTWWINNTGFLVGQRGVISIDTCATVRRTRAYLDAIRTVTAQPVRTVVNTHQCAPRGPAALAVGGIGAGDQRGIAAFVGVVS